MGNSKVTMEDIGNKLNVSKVTVSKALNNKGGVSPEMREKIAEVAKELGYNKTKIDEHKIHSICVVVRERYMQWDSNQPSYYVDIYHNLAREFAMKGYICNLVTVRHSVDNRQIMSDMFTQLNPDGIIVLGPIKPTYIEVIKKLKKTVLFLDSNANSSIGDGLIIDNYSGGYDLTKYSIDNNRNRIGFVGNYKATRNILDRYLGYCCAMIEKNLDIDPEWIISDRNDIGEGIDFELPENLPETFVCNCGESAYKVVEKLKQRGIKVPEEVSVLGFDDDVYSRFSNPKITVLAVEIRGMILKATNMICRNIENNGSSSLTKVTISGNLIERESFCKAVK